MATVIIILPFSELFGYNNCQSHLLTLTTSSVTFHCQHHRTPMSTSYAAFVSVTLNHWQNQIVHIGAKISLIIVP